MIIKNAALFTCCSWCYLLLFHHIGIIILVSTKLKILSMIWKKHDQLPTSVSQQKLEL